MDEHARIVARREMFRMARRLGRLFAEPELARLLRRVRPADAAVLSTRELSAIVAMCARPSTSRART